VDVAGCPGCDLLAGRRDVPGGIVHRTPCWAVNHAVGGLNLGTLMVVPREHIVAVADLADDAIAQLGPVLRDTARVVETLCRPEQTYVCSWAHGPAARKHLHIAVQPVTAAVVARYGGLRSERLQAEMLALGDEPAGPDVERFCDRARELFRAITSTGRG
jgi:ATP adenylyltransferase